VLAREPSVVTDRRLLLVTLEAARREVC